MKNFIGAAIFMIGGFISGYTQESQSARLSVLFNKAAVHPGLMAHDAAIESAELEQQIVKREIWPRLDLQAQNTYGTYKGLAGAVFPLPGNYNVSGLEGSGTAVNAMISATAKWDIIQFGKHRDQVKITGVQKDQAEVLYELKDLELKKEITQIYLDWIHVKMMKEWAKQEANRHRGLFKITKARVNAGQSSAADSLLVKSQYKQSLADEKKYSAEIQKAENKIAELTGVSLKGFKAPEKFTVPADARLPDENLSEHPLLIHKSNEEYHLELEKNQINHEVLPDISVLASGMFRGAGYSGEDQWGDPYRLPVNNYLVGLGLSWKLDGFYDKELKNKKNKKEQFRVQQEKESIKRSLSEQQKSLTYQINQAQEEIKETKESFEAARKSYDLFKVRYESGIIDLPALYQIEQSLQFAERSLLKSYHQYWMYWKEYAYLQNDYSVLIDSFN